MPKRKPTKKSAEHALEKGYVPSMNETYSMVLFQIAGKTLKAFFDTTEKANVFVEELALLGIQPLEGYPKTRKTKKRELLRRQSLAEKEIEVIAGIA